MKRLIAALTFLLLTPAFATEELAPTPASAAKSSVHRYLIERTFPAGALKGLDAATKKKVNANNASVGVRWVQSYANADETKRPSAKQPSSTNCRSTASPRCPSRCRRSKTYRIRACLPAAGLVEKTART